MKATLYYDTGKVERFPIDEIDTITRSETGLCVALSEGRGEKFCSFMTIDKY